MKKQWIQLFRYSGHNHNDKTFSRTPLESQGLTVDDFYFFKRANFPNFTGADSEVVLNSPIILPAIIEDLFLSLNFTGP